MLWQMLLIGFPSLTDKSDNRFFSKSESNSTKTVTGNTFSHTSKTITNKIFYQLKSKLKTCNRGVILNFMELSNSAICNADAGTFWKEGEKGEDHRSLILQIFPNTLFHIFLLFQSKASLLYHATVFNNYSFTPYKKKKKVFQTSSGPTFQDKVGCFLKLSLHGKVVTFHSSYSSSLNLTSKSL